jgi:hypothetical protein
MPKSVLGVIFVSVLIVLAFGGHHYFSGHRVPAGQPPLAGLDIGSLSSLKGEFNRSADGVRIILLLSPT